VSNNGTAQARKFDVELFLNEEREKKERLEDVAVGATAEVIFDGLKIRTPGSYDVKVKVDSDDEVNETDEQNNEHVSTFSNDCQDIPYEGDD
jgi:subtilase family serine protease